MSELQQLPARQGRAVALKAGQSIRIVNTHGHQVVDTWAFNAHDLGEFLSMEHMRAAIDRISPKPGDKLVTNKRRPILSLEADSSPGIHDTFIAACDIYRYQGLGCTAYHENCADNLRAGMAGLGLTPSEVPSPLNLWMNIPIKTDGSIGWEEPVSKPGDYVVLKAEMDCIVAMSACPQDIVRINAGAPTDAHYEVLA
ncbi:urea carboxylase-associated family protein [Hyphomicrobium sp.]|uniref:urea carboxylase-associated family protein n=1 Tax=Hyphomicrobium sp. TaxID=82 RepID=UPI001D91CCC9|nr:urea carboxylase-associated family protein [Hyphomicrobium sp.]MBY0559632.1 urea carboxylase-associated family protein [Hyphomicrobium sp.]